MIDGNLVLYNPPQPPKLSAATHPVLVNTSPPNSNGGLRHNSKLFVPPLTVNSTNMVKTMVVSTNKISPKPSNQTQVILSPTVHSRNLKHGNFSTFKGLQKPPPLIRDLAPPPRPHGVPAQPQPSPQALTQPRPSFRGPDQHHPPPRSPSQPLPPLRTPARLRKTPLGPKSPGHPVLVLASGGCADPLEKGSGIRW